MTLLGSSNEMREYIAGAVIIFVILRGRGPYRFFLEGRKELSCSEGTPIPELIRRFAMLGRSWDSGKHRKGTRRLTGLGRDCGTRIHCNTREDFPSRKEIYHEKSLKCYYNPYTVRERSLE